MVFIVKHSKTDQDRLTQDVIIGKTNNALCSVDTMWAYMCDTAHREDMQPLFTLGDVAVSYSQMLHEVKQQTKHIGLNPSSYGTHSFRIGGSQALAAAGRSITYIMSYGRWRCTESILRYVKTPLHIRILDAHHMTEAQTTTNWEHINTQIRAYYDNTSLQDHLWDATLMVK